ncbi:alkaline phosphatase [Psychroflexus planctonicus]|uniref:Alkaline phosphatase n=2 Tax=Psychroflexus planctonicus TaxID=1526575 RepID=A0ABQ1SH57_9FLAO|nr:alkaline phosphatase [Psychroflexus planctonicus]
MMNRRKFFKNGALATVGVGLLGACNEVDQISKTTESSSKKAKNIIFLVSDGMSQGTLTMADSLKQRMYGKASVWLDLYRNNKVNRALMDMASASSIVTDSAAASSSWGGGHRIPNGGINVGRGGVEHKPIWQKFLNAGKKAGIVTTVPITHATPAGFCVNSESRNDQDGIAEKYLDLGLSVMLGGGQDYFDANFREDGKDMYQAFANNGYTVTTERDEMLASANNKILGVFDKSGLAYTLDRNNEKEIEKQTPSLAEMTQKAIDVMKNSPEGFVLQVEGGKVDWAAHANDAGALIYDQMAFDDAVEVAMKFAEADEETLVIITTDHGNANPGIMYGKDVNENFDRLQSFKHSNDWILQEITKNDSVEQVRERIEYANNYGISKAQAQSILDYYKGLEKPEEGVYNYKKLPFKLLSEIQQEYHSVGWISTNHSGDFVELAMYGPHSNQLNSFMRNTDLHNFMLKATEVEDFATY